LICKQCAGEGVRLVGKISHPSDCSTCIAESLIRQKDHPTGIFTYERAAKLCSCLANNHEGAINANSSEEFAKIVQEHKRQYEAEQKERNERVFYHDKKIQESKDYYIKRVEELKKLDENGPEWILDDGVTDEEPEIDL